MKKILFVLITLMSISTLATAQKSRSGKSSSNSIRAERQIAITTNGGLKTMTSFGVIGSYYVTPNIAADLGVGYSILRGGPRFGARGRYLFTDNNFTPVLGAGFNVQTGGRDWAGGNFDVPVLDEAGEPVLDPNGIPLTQNIDADIKINSSVYGQFFTGFELMTDGGFVLGLTAGYRIALNDAIEGAISQDGDPVQITDEITDAANKFFGNGISIGLNLGYAF